MSVARGRSAESALEMSKDRVSLLLTWKIHYHLDDTDRRGQNRNAI